MRASWRLGRIAGIDLYVHATFLLLLAWVVFQEYSRGLAAIGGAMVYTVALFAIVVMHELGHALTARAFARRAESDERPGRRPTPNAGRALA